MAEFDLEASHLDTVNVFTNSLINKTIYCDMPEGFDETGICLQLLQALYGLRKSLMLWLKGFSRTLIELELQAIPGIFHLFGNA